ncbi:MAG: TonB family protein [Candidatus Sulfotelmatobacter sp.]
MWQHPGAVLEEVESPAPELCLLIVPDSWPRTFVQNVRDLFRRPSAPLELQSSPAAFWPDVFVERRLPWRRFSESAGYHFLALAIIWAGSRFLALQPQVTVQPAFTHADVVYYTRSEYLAPIDTRPAVSARAQKADPELAAQPIISVPREADNHSQTLVAAPNVRLPHDVPLPNTVAWAEKPRMPIAPAPLVPASEISRLAPQMERSIIAPPPEVQNDSRKRLEDPQSSVIAPPPSLEAASHRRLGELNIGHSTVIAPAPQLSLDEQRTAPRRSVSAAGRSPQVIAPPPSVGASSGSRASGALIALSLRPAVGAPPEPAAGNRRGTFAATPAGHRGASGTPGTAAGNGSSNASGPASKTTSKLPSGLYVGKASSPASPVAGDPAPASSNSNLVNPNLIAGVRPPRVSRTQPTGDPKISEAERAVFGGRKVYSLSLNMPNLNSGGGSWIIRFAAIKSDSAPVAPADPSGQTASSDSSADLSSPVATRKVDPAYPLELMRQNVSGTVILYGVILADGTVGHLRVLRSVDERIDRFAGEAIAKWQFQPATKNGSPVAVEATFWIPFRPTKAKSDF